MISSCSIINDQLSVINYYFSLEVSIIPQGKVGGILHQYFLDLTILTGWCMPEFT